MNMLQIIIAVASAACLIAAGVLTLRKRLHRAKMLSFCTRSADGEIYIRDPKTGTEHKFADYMAKRMAPDTKPVSPRQLRRIKRKYGVATTR